MLLTYSVPGISCEHCKTSIEGELDSLPGVAWSEVDVEAQTVVVQGEVTDDAVRAAIADVGYDEVVLVGSAEDVGQGLGVDDGEAPGGAGEGDVEGA